MKPRRAAIGILALILAGSLLAQLVSADPLPNAWQITDSGGSTLNYFTNLTVSQRTAATNSTGGFRFTVNARFVTDFSSSTETMTMVYSLGNRRFLVWWDRNDNLTARLEGGLTHTLTTNALDAYAYHTHEFEYTPATKLAVYRFDGVTITNWPGSVVAGNAGQVSWGAGSSTGQGQMNFHDVSFEITGLGVVAAYDAGTEGNPPVAPDPTALGWTLSQGANTSAGPIAQDNLFQPDPLGVLPGLAVGSTAWGDYDNDGRLDVLVAGYVTNAISQVWRNTGSGFTNVPIAGLPGVTYSTVAWGDYDNDGRLDFFLSGTTNGGNFGGSIAQIWRNTGGGFSNVTDTVAPGLLPFLNGSAAWGDYDDDGRLDLLLAGGTNLSSGSGISQLMRNTGSGFVEVTVPGLLGVADASVAWVDYNNDGRLDFFIAGEPPGSTPRIAQLWKNTGNGFSLVNVPGLPGISQGAIAWGDYDNDGRSDFLIVGKTDGTSSDAISQLWRNTGSGFTNVTLSAAIGLPGLYQGSVVWGDYDNDGRLDFLLAGFSPTLRDISQVWRNTGNGFTNINAALPGLYGGTPGGRVQASWADHDNDGRLDILLAAEFVDQIWKNNVATTNHAPAAPFGLAVTLSPPYMVLSWNTSTDDHTPAGGLRYNLRLGTSPGGSDALAPMSLSNGHRLLPQTGNVRSGSSARFLYQFGQTYYWSVQAIDTAFAGSPFAAERQFGGIVLGDTNGDGVVGQDELNSVLQSYWRNNPPDMQSIISPSNTAFRFGLTNLSSLNFHVRATTNLALPLANWTDIGLATLSYQFTDPGATNYPARFYQLIWP